MIDFAGQIHYGLPPEVRRSFFEFLDGNGEEGLLCFARWLRLSVPMDPRLAAHAWEARNRRRYLGDTYLREEPVHEADEALLASLEGLGTLRELTPYKDRPPSWDASRLFEIHAPILGDIGVPVAPSSVEARRGRSKKVRPGWALDLAPGVIASIPAPCRRREGAIVRVRAESDRGFGFQGPRFRSVLLPGASRPLLVLHLARSRHLKGSSSSPKEGRCDGCYGTGVQQDEAIGWDPYTPGESRTCDACLGSGGRYSIGELEHPARPNLQRFPRLQFRSEFEPYFNDSPKKVAARFSK